MDVRDSPSFQNAVLRVRYSGNGAHIGAFLLCIQYILLTVCPDCVTLITEITA